MGQPVEDVPEIKVDPNKIGRSKNEKVFLKEMFSYQQAHNELVNNDDSAIQAENFRNSNVSNYDTGNNIIQENVEKNPVDKPGAAEFEIYDFSPDKNAHLKNHRSNSGKKQKLDDTGEGAVKKSDISDLEPENLNDSRDDGGNDNILFNQKNFLKEMQGYQQAGADDYDSARKQTFGANQQRKSHKQQQLQKGPEPNLKSLLEQKQSKTVYFKSQKIQDDDKDKKEEEKDGEDPEIIGRRSKSFMQKKNYISLDSSGYNNYFTKQPPQINEQLVDGQEDFRGRGLTKIRELLINFQDDDDFLISKRHELDTEMDQQTNYLNQSNQFIGSKVFSQGGQEVAGHDIESSQVMANPRSRKMTVKSSSSNKNFLQLLEESKKMLYDIKQFEDQQQVEIQVIEEVDEDGDAIVQFHPKNPRELNVQFTDGSQDMDFDQEHEHEIEIFQSRKQTIIKNMTMMIDAKYADNKDKQEDMINQVKDSLNQEEERFRLASVRIKHQRQTIKKKKNQN